MQFKKQNKYVSNKILDVIWNTLELMVIRFWNGSKPYLYDPVDSRNQK